LTTATRREAEYRNACAAQRNLVATAAAVRPEQQRRVRAEAVEFGGVRVGILATAVILLGCGTDERDRPEPPAASTRAAGTDFLRRCAREAASATVAVRCPTRLPIGGFERPTK